MGPHDGKPLSGIGPGHTKARHGAMWRRAVFESGIGPITGKELGTFFLARQPD